MTFPRLVASSAVMMFALWGCGKTETPQPPAAESKPAEQPAPAADAAPAASEEVLVKIGVAAPLTGPQSHYGKGIENAVRMAADEANASALEIGGKKIKFEVLAEDDQADQAIPGDQVDQGGAAKLPKLPQRLVAGLLVRHRLGPRGSPGRFARAVPPNGVG